MYSFNNANADACILNDIQNDVRTLDRAKLRTIIIRTFNGAISESLEAAYAFLDDLRAKLGSELFHTVIIAEYLALFRSAMVGRDLLLNGTPPVMVADMTFLPLVEIKKQQKIIFMNLAKKLLHDATGVAANPDFGISQDDAEALLAAHDSDLDKAAEDLWLRLWIDRHLRYLAQSPDDGVYSFAFPESGDTMAPVLAGFQCLGEGPYRQYNPELGVFLDTPTAVGKNTIN